MRIHLLVLLLLIAASVLAGVHLIALELSLYYVFAAFDIPMHFLGGAVIALMIFALAAIEFPLPRFMTKFGPVILSVCIVGIMWEAFEVWAGIPMEHDYFADTALDLVMDLVGGVVGYFVGSRLIQL